MEEDNILVKTIKEYVSNMSNSEIQELVTNAITTHAYISDYTVVRRLVDNTFDKALGGHFSIDVAYQIYPYIIQELLNRHRELEAELGSIEFLGVEN